MADRRIRFPAGRMAWPLFLSLPARPPSRSAGARRPMSSGAARLASPPSWLWQLCGQSNGERTGFIYHEEIVMSVAVKQDVKSLIREGAELTDEALEALIPAAEAVPASIHGAMRHSVFAGGKRLRPVLAIQSAVAVAGSVPTGIGKLAAALEMLHTYSLIHDDLPALDNDDLRRGKPTCHVVFGEAIAILAGDALQTQAYETLASLDCPSAATVEIIRLIARATGTVDGMIGGQ